MVYINLGTQFVNWTATAAHRTSLTVATQQLMGDNYPMNGILIKSSGKVVSLIDELGMDPADFHFSIFDYQFKGPMFDLTVHDIFFKIGA